MTNSGKWQNLTDYKMKMSVFFNLLVLILLFSGVLSENPISNFRYDWKCATTLVRTGNFPETPDLAEFVKGDGANWTSATTQEEDLLAHKWENIDSFSELYIKPHQPGPENKIIIHLAGSLDNPFQSPYPKISTDIIANATKLSSFDQAKDVLMKGPFNCHIRRDIDSMNDLLKEYIEDCSNTGSLLNCLEAREVWKSFQCAAGASSPVCCYVDSLKEKDKVDKLEILKSLYGQGISKDLKKCQKQQKPATNDYKKICPVPPRLSKKDQDKFYIFNKNTSCNPFLRPTATSCSINRNGAAHVMPCLGRCLTGMFMNLEVIPTDPANPEILLADVDMVITVRYAEFNQRYYDADRDKLWTNISVTKTQNEFGYNANLRKVKPNDQVMIMRKRVGQIKLEAGTWNGIWLKWVLRNPKCLKSANRSIKAPVLMVGLEGDLKAAFEVDFGCTNFDQDKNDKLGFRYGWFAKDLLLPKLPAVWRPNYFAVNSLNGSNFSYRFGGNKQQCNDQRKAGPMPPLLILALILGITLIVLIIFICEISD